MQRKNFFGGVQCLMLFGAILVIPLMIPALSSAGDPSFDFHNADPDDQAEEDPDSTSIYDGSILDGGLYLFGRRRMRKDDVPEGTHEYEKNLIHLNSIAAINYKTKNFYDIVSAEAGGFGSVDFYLGNVTNDIVNQENEFSFAAKYWGENYKPSDDGDPQNGISLLKAKLNLELPTDLFLSYGIGQFRVPGVIGQNWSYMPGSSRGGSAIWDIKDIVKLTYAYVDRYKAPWFIQLENFSTQNAWDDDKFDGDNKIDYLHGLAAEFNLLDTNLTFSVGEAEGYMWSYFAKIAKDFKLLDGLSLNYQFYGSDTKDKWDTQSNGYDGLAYYQAITGALQYEPYTFNLEATYVKAEGPLGNYLPRMTRGYGNSQGALEIWWDLRSDWNGDNETAVFGHVSRELNDLVGFDGLKLGFGGAYGWGVKYEPGGLSDGSESAWKIDLSYTGDIYPFNDVTFMVHYMNYTNYQDELGDWTFPNLFSSEHDLMVKVILPFGLTF